jgi:hypothetical protein
MAASDELGRLDLHAAGLEGVNAHGEISLLGRRFQDAAGVRAFGEGRTDHARGRNA